MAGRLALCLGGAGAGLTIRQTSVLERNQGRLTGNMSCLLICTNSGSEVVKRMGLIKEPSAVAFGEPRRGCSCRLSLEPRWSGQGGRSASLVWSWGVAGAWPALQRHCGGGSPGSWHRSRAFHQSPRPDASSSGKARWGSAECIAGTATRHVSPGPRRWERPLHCITPEVITVT